jgi:hypothetical protein
MADVPKWCRYRMPFVGLPSGMCVAADIDPRLNNVVFNNGEVFSCEELFRKGLCPALNWKEFNHLTPEELINLAKPPQTSNL